MNLTCRGHVGVSHLSFSCEVLFSAHEYILVDFPGLTKRKYGIMASTGDTNECECVPWVGLAKHEVVITIVIFM